jgi:hypothetical protein
MPPPRHTRNRTDGTTMRRFPNGKQRASLLKKTGIRNKIVDQIDISE